MLSQHIITKPVFDALFENYSFVANNPMSQSMQKMLDLLEEQSFEKDAETLQKFIESVKMRASQVLIMQKVNNASLLSCTISSLKLPFLKW
jgi:predicted helicase